MSTVVLIAIDESPQADLAFAWYLDNLHKTNNKLVILHSVDPSAISESDHDVTSEAAFTKMWHQERGKIRAREDQFRCRLDEQAISGKFRTENGKAGEMIIKVSKEEHASLIVIGSRGLGALKRTLQGSISDHVLHHAHCPVCICRE